MIITLLSLLVMAVMLFGFVPEGHAQSTQGWSEPVNLSFSGAASSPQMVIDVRGVYHVVWIDKIDGYLYSESRDGLTWTTPRKAKFPFGVKDAPPVFIADKTGVIHIFWTGGTEGALFYGQSTGDNFANPSNWVIRSRLARSVIGYDVLIDSQGIMHIAFIRRSSSDINPSGVYYRQSAAGGSFWTEAVLLYESEYFRNVISDDIYLRLAVSNQIDNKKIYVVWDNRPQKRVFMAKSLDAGVTWSEADQVKSPEDTGGYDAPFNITVGAVQDRLLLMWQVGEPGSPKCTVYSQWSTDAGQTWGDPLAVLGGRSACPDGIRVLMQEGEYFTVLLSSQGEPMLISWNGDRWSEPQTQIQLPSFSDPFTYESVLLGCRQDLVYDGRLFVLGCDEGKGGDVWLTSRPLDSVESWFSPPSVWGSPVILGSESQKISFLTFASDRTGNLHAVWAQASSSQKNSLWADIQYAQWDGRSWSNPKSAMSFSGGSPIQLSTTIDTQERLLVTWVDGTTGDLLFSWANLDRANLPSEWEEPKGIPSISKSNSSPDILVDGSDRIVVAYAVPVNEDRGVYVIQSTDNGATWAASVKVFDAAFARWEMIDQPKLTLGRDGRLHLLFTRRSLREGQPGGLYYSQSQDGGTTWSEPQIVSEEMILWSEIVSYGDNTVHRVWQEDDGLVIANLSQVSNDGGLTWGKAVSITGVTDHLAPVTLAANPSGELHFIELSKMSDEGFIKEDKFSLQDWKWDGSSWISGSTGELLIKGEGIQYSIAAGITAKGFLGVSVSAEYSDLNNEVANDLLSFRRFLGEPDPNLVPALAIIPTPMAVSVSTPVPIIQPTMAPDTSILYDDNISRPISLKNLVGASFIGFVLILTTILLIRGRPALKKK